MQVILNKGPRILGGKFYAKGKAEIPDALSADWFLKALMDSGDISLVASMKDEAEAKELAKADDAQPKMKKGK